MAGKGKLAGREKSGSHRNDSNSGGSMDHGLPFVHFKPGFYRHHSRYMHDVHGKGWVFCLKCGETLIEGSI